MGLSFGGLGLAWQNLIFGWHEKEQSLGDLISLRGYCMGNVSECAIGLTRGVERDTRGNKYHSGSILRHRKSGDKGRSLLLAILQHSLLSY